MPRTLENLRRIFIGTVAVALTFTAAGAEAQELDSAAGPVAVFADDFESGNLCTWSGGAGFPPVCPYNFFCAGDVAPTSAVDPLTVAGAVTDLISGNPLAGATVEARRLAGGTLLDTDTTAGDGSFSLTASTGGTPLAAYLQLAASGYPATYFYPADPFAADVAGVGVRAINSSSLALAYVFAGIGAQTPGTGTSAAIVTDCNGVAIAGATVGFSPAAGALRYLSGGTPSPSATSTDASGIAIGFNAPAGNTSVSAQFNGVSLESHGFVVTAGGLIGTLIHP